MQESHDTTLALYLEELYLTMKDNVKFQREIGVWESRLNEIDIESEQSSEAWAMKEHLEF